MAEQKQKRKKVFGVRNETLLHVHKGLSKGEKEPTSDLARRLNLNSATVKRACTTLEQLGVCDIERVGTNRKIFLVSASRPEHGFIQPEYPSA